MKKTRSIAALLLAAAVPPFGFLACDESKYDKYKTDPAEAAAVAAASASAAAALANALASASASASAATVTIKKKSAADCKPHPTTVEFDDAPLEAEVRRKLSKEAGALTPADLGQIKSINLSNAKLHQIDPCVFPMFTSVKDVFLGPGDYDDLTPLQKLTTIETLRVSFSQVKDLHAIEGLKKMDRLDISHTLVGDDQFKSVGALVNVTELTMDETNVSDLTPVANMKKLERLSIKKTQVKSLAPLSQLKSMKFLYIADTPLTDITPVQPLVSGGMKLINQ
jgi:internalin A